MPKTKSAGNSSFATTGESTVFVSPLTQSSKTLGETARQKSRFGLGGHRKVLKFQLKQKNKSKNNKIYNLLKMIDKESINKISNTILSFDNWSNPWEFEEFVLNKIENTNDQMLFKTIWTKSILFENWNYSDLNIGILKTIKILKDEFNLNELVSKQIATAASYQWK